MRSFSTFLKKIEWLHLFAYLLCTSFFSVQMYKLVENLVVPTKTHTYVREVPLKDMDFPLDLKICVNPSMNQTAVKEFGYEDIPAYIIGTSWAQFLSSNFSMISWGGLGGNSTPVANASEVFKAVKLNLIKDIVKEMYIDTFDDIFLPANLSLNQLVQINRLHACHVLTFDQNKQKTLAGMKLLGIVFNEMKHSSTVRLKLQGRGLILHRDQQRLRFDSFRDTFKLIPKKLSKYVVKIKKRVFKKDDSSKTCRDYPTPEFESYTECDDDYARKKIEQIAPGLNLTPVWMTDNLDMVTSKILRSGPSTPSIKY